MTGHFYFYYSTVFIQGFTWAVCKKDPSLPEIGTTGTWLVMHRILLPSISINMKLHASVDIYANISMCMSNSKSTTNNRTIHLKELKERPVDHH